MKTCLWVILAGLVFLVSFFSSSIAMSLIYPLGSAPLGF